MPQGERIYGGLTYANVQPTYVGLPLNEIDELGKKLETDYQGNRERADKIDITIANLDVRDENYPIMKAALEKSRETLKQHTEKGDWEYAGTATSKAAREFATDPTIKLALKDKELYDSWNTNLTANKNILDEDKDYARIKSKINNNKAVEYDPITGQAKNVFNGETPPEYVDINDEVRKITKDMTPSTKAMLLQHAERSGYLKSGSVTELSEKDLEKVAKDYIESSPKAQAYLNFQAEKADYMNRLTRDEQGNLTTKPIDFDYLKRTGVIDDKGNTYITKTNDKNQYIYVDKNGKEFDPANNNITQYNGEIYQKDKNGKAFGEPLEQKKEINTDLQSKLFNSDGSINQNIAESQVRNNYKAHQQSKHIDYANDFAYKTEDVNYIEDALSRDARQHQYSKDLKQFEHDLNNPDTDFYVDALMGLGEGETKTLPPQAANALFNNGKADLRESILQFAQSSPLKGLSAKEQRLIPFVSDLKDIQGAVALSSLLKEQDAINKEWEEYRIKGKNSTNRNFKDLEKAKADIEKKYRPAIKDASFFSMVSLGNDISKLQAKLAEFEKTTGTTVADASSFYDKYNKLSKPEKEAVQTLGKIMNLPQAPVSMLNKDNVKKVDGNTLLGVIATLDDTQLNLSTDEIANLNSLFDTPILTTSKVKTPTADNKSTIKDVREVKLYLEHKSSPEAQQSYNKEFGVPTYNQKHRDKFNQKTISNITRTELANNPYGYYNSIIPNENREEFKNATKKINGADISLYTLFKEQAEIATNKESSSQEKAEAADAMYAIFESYKLSK